VHYNARVTFKFRGAFGICGAAGKDDPEVDSWAERTSSTASDNVVPEVFVPLDIAQSAYFAHFVDCLMPKLVYAIELRRRAPMFYAKLRVYLPGNEASRNTYSMLRHLNVSWTHVWPSDTRFKAVVWVCHTPPISPPQGGAVQVESSPVHP
jgi:hypothetical protein